MAHEGNHICLHRFSFIYAVNDLWKDAYTCPIYAMNRTTESAHLRYGTLGYKMDAYKGGDDKMQSFSMSCDSSIVRGISLKV